MTKQADTLTFDFTGSSRQSKYSVNCSKWASLGGLFAPLFPLLCYDIVWNEGARRPITMIAPDGSIVNSTRPAPVSVATVGAIQSVNNAACSTIGKMLAASEKYADEATAVWHANHFAIFMFGNNQRGRLAICRRRWRPDLWRRRRVGDCCARRARWRHPLCIVGEGVAVSSE
jgi:N-methylhydantoinase B